MPYKDSVPLGDWSGSDLFQKIVYYLSYTKHNTPEEIADELLRELKKFEKDFADYILKQTDINNRRSDYVNHAIDLYRDISRFNKHNSNQIDDVNVLSFNYSLDERFMDDILRDDRMETWSNIHGIAFANNPNSKTAIKRKDDYGGEHDAPLPIFGINNHDIVAEHNKNDLRTLFTKLYRVLANNVNGIRNSKGYTSSNLISIYGHSLGRADYSYFETIFDECDLYNSDVKIEYFYYSGDQTEKLQKRHQAIVNMYNLLTDYGFTLGNSHGSGIVNRLNIQNRLSIVPMESLPQ